MSHRDTSGDRVVGGITFIYSTSRIAGCWVCQTCGAQVGNYARHGEYHARLTRRVRILESLLNTTRDYLDLTTSGDVILTSVEEEEDRTG